MKRSVARRCVCVVAILAAAFAAFRYSMNSTDEIILNGNVEIHDVNVSFRVSGKIGKVLADEGQEVKEGETLATLVSDTLFAKAELAKAQLNEPQVNLKNAEKN
ncbi:MAG: biotin/lipoyl-binding protein, partial [Holosporales bacterium]|nr:biotin/lipoyl-binding protein [Holosporales bacterium]